MATKIEVYLIETTSSEQRDLINIQIIDAVQKAGKHVYMITGEQI